MRRRLFTNLLAAAVAIAPCLSGNLHAADDKDSSSLPLKRIVLFNSGVGFFEHGGEVTGDATVDLKFKVDDVNDLLKSLVPQDLGGGQASTVTYGSKDPITKTLKTFAIDLTEEPTIAELLNQVRGEAVAIEAARPIKGRILGVEKRKRAAADDKIVEEDFLNLVTDDGLKSVALASLQSIRLLNEDLDAELQQALLLLASDRSNDKKNVSLRFTGEGKRPVRVSYIQEAPVWKTSYRLVLDDEKQPLLQGWAIVENTTEEDWRDVQLTLVSGRPISFVMNLYDPLYVPRPTVEPELFASLRPQRYGQDMAGAEREFAEAGKKLQEKQSEMLARKAMPKAAAAPGANRAGLLGSAAVSDSQRQRGLGLSGDGSFSSDLDVGFASAAEASNLGELFQYEIDAPVKLPRQQSAMLPIVAETVKGEKVSIFNAAVHPKHPLNGLRLTNSTKLHLMQGPITVFDAGSYAGDAQIEDLPAGSERLISYAVDLDTEVVQRVEGKPNQIVSLKIVRGVLQVTNKVERETSFTVKNSGRKESKVLLEYPLDPSWKLTAPEKPSEKTRDRYRFALAAPVGKPVELKVAEEQLNYMSLGLTNIDDGSLLVYLRSKVISDEVRKAVEEVRSRNAALQELRTKHANVEQQIRVIGEEQSRIRQNMSSLRDPNSELHQRYVKKFGEQEDAIERLRIESLDLQQQIDAKTKELADFVGGLNVS
jgi:hypothetical protein